MTITEATAAQYILRGIAEYHQRTELPIEPSYVDAGAVLAAKSHKVLGAGMSADEWRRQVGAAGRPARPTGGLWGGV